MKTKLHDVDDLLRLDFDEVGESARSLRDEDRRVALDNVLSALRNCIEAGDRLKLMLFVQTSLAFVTDGTLEAPLAERAAVELTKIITSMTDHAEVKRSAVTAVALLLIKASELTDESTVILRDALTTASTSLDPEAAGFARRVIERQQHLPSPGAASVQRTKILLIHGQDELNVLRLEKFIGERWAAPVVVFNDLPRGRSIIERFEREASGAGFAMVVLTRDDLSEAGHTSSRAGRSDVTFELALAYGRLGRSRVWLLIQKGARLPADLEGIQRLEFADNILDVSSQLLTELESRYGGTYDAANDVTA